MTDHTRSEPAPHVLKLAVIRDVDDPETGRPRYVLDPAHGRLEASVWNFFLELGESRTKPGARQRQDRYAGQMIRGLIDGYAREAQDAEAQGNVSELRAWRVEETRTVVVIGPADRLMQASDDDLNSMARQALEGTTEDAPEAGPKRRTKPRRR